MTITEKQQQMCAEISALYPAPEASSITQWVFENTVQLDALQLHLQRHSTLTENQLLQLNVILKRILTHEPIQYILSESWFMGHKFFVDKSVLIPRPETEELVDWVLAEVAAEKEHPISILDIGTGSGCIPISLALNLPTASITGIDISPAALAVAEKNNAFHQTSVQFSVLDILAEIPTKKYSIVVSNPPYIGFDEKEKMRKNVLDFEPNLALFSADPLAFYKRFAEIGKEILLPKGRIFLELNEYYASEIEKLFIEKDYKKVCLRTDFYGKKRMLLAAV